MRWFEQAQAAEQSGDWDTAIPLVSAHAECYSTDYTKHGNHLWHMDLLVHAGRLAELTDLAHMDIHARRRLNRALRDRGLASVLHERAETGDRDALYRLVRLLCETGRTERARETVEEIAPRDQYAQEILAAFEASSSPSP
ncbi:tetratricopeptide repeat protein [Streptomyces sp. cg35]|uniref:tetratricopeptide repeat protein n=1 Tax=Streptomyces sp. cg35 TaxID=3421650 RepID=UPI003D1691CE